MLRLATLCTTALLITACNRGSAPANDQANAAAPANTANATAPANGTDSAAATADEFPPLAAGWNADLLDGEGRKVGMVVFTGADAKGVQLAINLRGLPPTMTTLPPGEHGMHLHEVGQCRPPKFETAGAHWNPAGRQHGHANPQGAHAGDLGNIRIDGAGNGAASVAIPAGLGGHPTGLSLVIHAKADDEKTDPSGNSGDRVACAVLIKAPGT